MREDKFLMRFLIISGVIVSSIISVAIIVTVAYITIVTPEAEIPEVLTNWGGLIIGFYFGSFLSLVKDWLKLSESAEGGENKPK